MLHPLRLSLVLALFTPLFAETAQVAPSSAPPTLAVFSKETPPLIPAPRELKRHNGATRITAVTLAYPKSATDTARFAHLGKEAGELFGIRGVKPAPAGSPGYPLRFTLSNDTWFSDKPEGYRLKSGADGATVEARTATGLFYGLQTLAQLTTRRADGTHIAHAEIKDWPAFPIRGTMNDTGRNYMPLSMLKEMAEVLARYKMNVYHWHFTDNHGWRLESKKHPQVNDRASFDRMPGKYFTQAEFREFVEYCRVRHITVIPELDMPGHTASFRRAFGVEKMDDPEVTAIQQTWTNRKRPPAKGGEYIDSQENYLNHFDPFEMVNTLFFRKNCPHTTSKGIGGILCSWPDMPMKDPRNHFAQTPHFPGVVVYSEALWSDAREKDWIEFYSNLPPQGHEELETFREFENRFVAHRDLFFQGKEFPYVRQSNIVWQTLGPIPHGGKPESDFGIRAGDTRTAVEVDGKAYKWSDEARTGATMVFRHYTDQPTFANPTWGRQTVAESTYFARTHIHSPKEQTVPFWISAQWWELSNFHGGMNQPGEVHFSKPVFQINGVKIEAPAWAVPNRKPDNHSTDSFVDENYHFRAPTPIKLRQGWNEVLIKSPHVKGMRRWMFTFVPVLHDPGAPVSSVREFPGLRFAVKPE